MPPTTANAPSSATKRKASSAGLPGSTRPVKRRASKACHCCRSRKVRCDVVESGIPCTNCRLDEVECLVTEGKRRRKSYIEGDLLHHSPIDSVEDKDDVQKFPLFDDIDGLQDVALPQNQGCDHSPTNHNSHYDPSSHKPHMIYQTQTHRMTPEERTQRISTFGHHPRLSITPVQLPAHLQYYPTTPTRPDIVLPRYITPIPRQMLSEDLDYLQRKGAFLIPETGIRNELLRSYVQYVHPYLPLLELEDFLSAIQKNEPGNTVSLLLYHAVMFAASAYVDMRHLTAQGYSSRKAARKAYFQRVKLLYDFDWEVDRVTVVQAVLLMTYWYESPNDPKDVWYWLGIAISIARTIGLNYNTESTSLLSPQKRRLWKRIWWSTYLRDRVIAVGMRRPIRIRDEDFDVPMWQLEDFETDSLSPELCRMLGGCSAVRDSSKRKTLANLCIALTEVCHRISDVLAIQYSVLGHRIGVTSETTVRLVPKSTGADSSEVIRCDRDLENWYENLPAELRYFKNGSRERTNNHDGEVICVHRALLTSVYMTATSALHRPQMMPAMPNLVVAPELKELSKRRVHSAALDITEIYRDLYAHDLIRYLPNTGVTVLLPAIIIHILDIKSQDGADKQTSLRHFHFCMQALQKLRDLYASADFSFSYLDAAIRRSEMTNGKDRLSLLDDHDDDQSVATGKPSSTRTKPGDNSVALTPPPDVQDNRSKYVDQSTIDSRLQDLDVLTPESSEQPATMFDTSGLAISLTDLERFVDLNAFQQANDSTLPVYPDIELNVDNGTQLREISVVQPDNTTIDDESFPVNGFDQLVNFEGGSDLFAPNLVNIDDSLFKDIDMEWLADANDEEEKKDEKLFLLENTQSPPEQVKPSVAPEKKSPLSEQISTSDIDNQHNHIDTNVNVTTPVASGGKEILVS